MEASPRQENRAVAERLASGKRVLLHRHPSPQMTFLQTWGLLLVGLVPLLGLPSIWGPRVIWGPEQTVMLIAWWILLALVALHAGRDRCVARRSAVQITDSQLHYWDWRGREHTVSWGDIAEVDEGTLVPWHPGVVVRYRQDGTRARLGIRLIPHFGRAGDLGDLLAGLAALREVRHALAEMVAQRACLAPVPPRHWEIRGFWAATVPHRWKRVTTDPM